jgi:hypothetical protein
LVAVAKVTAANKVDVNAGKEALVELKANPELTERLKQ